MWLTTVPNRGENPSGLFSAIQKQVSNCKIHRFEIPSLVVGTLDSLMALSDDLNKINTQVEVCYVINHDDVYVIWDKLISFFVFCFCNLL